MELHATFIQNMCNLSSFSMVLCSFVIAAWGGQLYDRLKNLTEVMWSLRWTFKMPSPAESFSAWQKLQPICEWWAEGLLWSCFPSLRVAFFFFFFQTAEVSKQKLTVRCYSPAHGLSIPDTIWLFLRLICLLSTGLQTAYLPKETWGRVELFQNQIPLWSWSSHSL